MFLALVCCWRGNQVLIPSVFFFFVAHRLWHHMLWQKVPLGSPVFWERSPNFPFHRWAPSHTCLFCGSPPRHSGWAGSTAAPGHGNRRRAHLWMVRLFPRPCIHPPKRRKESQIKVSCLIEKGRVSYDERQTTAWRRWKSPRLCQCYCSQMKSRGVWPFILSLTSLKYHLLVTAEMPIRCCTPPIKE